MTVSLVLGGLLLLLVVACRWEARSGRPAWRHPDERSAGGVGDAARAGTKGAAASAAALGLAVGIDGGDG